MDVCSAGQAVVSRLQGISVHISRVVRLVRVAQVLWQLLWLMVIWLLTSQFLQGVALSGGLNVWASVLVGH